ncbi:MAG TPA: heme NO-binding domain-containing protein, partial [Prosthecobacter sp.]|nr:heme NO-binding domain-containing protein [Prosthecobacter sp.]
MSLARRVRGCRVLLENMKGIIFNLLEDVVTAAHGEAVWDDLLRVSGVNGAFTSLGNYPDEDLFKLVGAASQALSLPPNSIVRWFGTQALPRLAAKYPEFFAQHSAARPFILTLNGIIHPEVRKLYPGAATPDFEFDASSPATLIMSYRSQRKLCALAEGLIEGAATHYGETVMIA